MRTAENIHVTITHEYHTTNLVLGANVKRHRWNELISELQMLSNTSSLYQLLSTTAFLGPDQHYTTNSRPHLLAKGRLAVTWYIWWHTGHHQLTVINLIMLSIRGQG